ncbi:unnamed protein product, partial [Prorocentrum cordatum]
KQQWRLIYDEQFMSARKRAALGKGIFDETDPTDPASARQVLAVHVEDLRETARGHVVGHELEVDPEAFVLADTSPTCTPSPPPEAENISVRLAAFTSFTGEKSRGRGGALGHGVHGAGSPTAAASSPTAQLANEYPWSSVGTASVAIWSGEANGPQRIAPPRDQQWAGPIEQGAKTTAPHEQRLPRTSSSIPSSDACIGTSAAGTKGGAATRSTVCGASAPAGPRGSPLELLVRGLREAEGRDAGRVPRGVAAAPRTPWHRRAEGRQLQCWARGPLAVTLAAQHPGRPGHAVSQPRSLGRQMAREPLRGAAGAWAAADRLVQRLVKELSEARLEIERLKSLQEPAGDAAPGSWRDRELAARPALQAAVAGARVCGRRRRRRNAAWHARRVPVGGFATASDAAIAEVAAGPRLGAFGGQAERVPVECVVEICQAEAAVVFPRVECEVCLVEPAVKRLGGGVRAPHAAALRGEVDGAAGAGATPPRLEHLGGEEDSASVVQGHFDDLSSVEESFDGQEQRIGIGEVLAKAVGRVHNDCDFDAAEQQAQARAVSAIRRPAQGLSVRFAAGPRVLPQRLTSCKFYVVRPALLQLDQLAFQQAAAASLPVFCLPFSAWLSGPPGLQWNLLDLELGPGSWLQFRLWAVVRMTGCWPLQDLHLVSPSSAQVSQFLFHQSRPPAERRECARFVAAAALLAVTGLSTNWAVADLQWAFDVAPHLAMLLKAYEAGVRGDDWLQLDGFVSSDAQYIALRGHVSRPAQGLSVRFAAGPRVATEADKVSQYLFHQSRPPAERREHVHFVAAAVLLAATGADKRNSTRRANNDA